MRIVIPGGSGQIGSILARHFRAAGHSVIVLRRPQWDGVTLGDWVETLDGADVLIHLAGRSVNCRYTPANRRRILDSRVQSTQVLHRAIAAVRHPPRLWMNASTATIYRHSLDKDMDEVTGELGGHEPDAPDTWNFSIAVATQWEAAFFSGQTPRTRRIALRSAMTFSPDPGGVFAVLAGLARYGLGGTQGTGKQYVSWIHESDFVRAIDLLIAREDLEGVVNLASPHPLPNAAFMRVLRQALGTGRRRHGSWRWARSSCGRNRNWCSKAAVWCRAVY